MSKPGNANGESLMKTAKLPNVFNLELNPPKPSVINPDVPLTVTLKNVTEHRQEVVVDVDSFLFEIINPRATVWPFYQVYTVLEPGASMSFQIGAIKETPKEVKPEFGKCQDQDNCYMASRALERMKKPEGTLYITHSITEKKGDTDWDWEFEQSSLLDYYLLPGRRLAGIRPNPKYDIGVIGWELNCQKETELIKKRKEEFNKMRMAEKLEEEKLRKKKEKKCCSCTVL